jgi:hypothetical protein
VFVLIVSKKNKNAEALWLKVFIMSDLFVCFLLSITQLLMWRLYGQALNYFSLFEEGRGKV